MFYNNPKLTFSIIGIYSLKGKPISISEKNRNYFAISLRVKGNSRFIYQNKEISATDGTLMYIPKGADYTRHTYKNEELYVIQLAACEKIEENIQSLDDCLDTEHLFEAALKEWESSSDTRYNRCMSYVYRIFEQLQLKSQTAKSALPESIKAGAELMKSDFRNPMLTVNSLAEACHVSGTYFRRIYKNFYGISPLQALLNLRFDYAKSLLASGYFTTTESALASGFSDVKYFRTAFKKRFGITPGEYSHRPDML